MNATAPIETDRDLESRAVAFSEGDPVAATVAESTETDWLCAWCQNVVASERDRFQQDGKDEFTFSNPQGVRFEIITFGETVRCHETGEPTLEHTWFSGYAWSYCQCNRCGQHLGWYYSGQNRFVGLIKDHIVRALFVRN